MTRLICLSNVLLLMALSTETIADEQSPSETSPVNEAKTMLLKRFDSNADGTLSQDELEAATRFQKLIDEIDIDQSGELSAGELDTVGRRSFASLFFTSRDSNRDGLLTVDEFEDSERSRNAFQRMDKDGDGRVQPSEMGIELPAQPATMGDRDTNGDGVLTIDEFPDTEPAMKFFRLFDKDKDGRLTREESEAAGIAMKTHGRRESTAATTALDPKKVLLFVVGLCDFEGENHFSKPDRMEGAIALWFRKNGTPNDRIVLLQDEQATAARIKARFRSLLARSQPDDQLIFFISTHGGKSDGSHCFCTYDGYSNDANTWPFEDMFDTIEEHFRGESAMIWAECCYAGGLNQEAMARSTGRISYVVMGASRAAYLAPGAFTFC